MARHGHEVGNVPLCLTGHRAHVLGRRAAFANSTIIGESYF